MIKFNLGQYCNIFFTSVRWAGIWDLVSGSYPYTQHSSPVIMVLMKSGSLFVKSSMSWVYGKTRNPSFSLQWKSEESPKHYLIQMLLVINCRYWQAGKIHACIWGFKVASCKLAGFRGKIGYFSNRVVYEYYYMCIAIRYPAFNYAVITHFEVQHKYESFSGIKPRGTVSLYIFIPWQNLVQKYSKHRGYLM